MLYYIIINVEKYIKTMWVDYIIPKIMKYPTKSWNKRTWIYDLQDINNIPYQ